MRIILDVMSGDNAPGALIEGGIAASEASPHTVILVGDEEIIKTYAKDHSLCIDPKNIKIVHAPQVITMDDDALSIKNKKNSSMATALRLLKEGYGDAVVSAGNTGALYAGSVLYLSRIKGIKKAAIATVLPFSNPVLLLDCGANTNVTEEHLEKFALMGDVYARMVMKLKTPRIALLSNGSEKRKGTVVCRSTYELLENNETINFVGNVEGKDLPFDVCDVIVTDGFTGNVLLKSIEGMGAFFSHKLKLMFKGSLVSASLAALLKPQLKKLKKDFDASEYGGAPFLGISAPVIKAHGSSDALAIKNAVFAAATYAKTGVTEQIEQIIFPTQRSLSESKE